MQRLVTSMAAASLLVAGCSSSGGKSAPGKSEVKATATASAALPATTYGQDAALLAARVPGCAASAAEVGDGGATGMVSKATCRIAGHAVVIYTWKDRASQDSADELAAGGLKYFASGVGWDQILGDDAGVDAQKQIATVVADALGGDVITGSA